APRPKINSGSSSGPRRRGRKIVRRIGLTLSLFGLASLTVSTAATVASAATRAGTHWSMTSADLKGVMTRLRGSARPGNPNGPDWQGESNQRIAWYGYEVGPAGDVNGDGYDDAVVGAYRYDANGMTDSGKAWLYYGGPDGLSLTAGWTVDGPWPGAM